MKKSVVTIALMLSGSLVYTTPLVAQQHPVSHSFAVSSVLLAGSPLRYVTPLDRGDRPFDLSTQHRLGDDRSWFAHYGSYLLGREDADLQLREYLHQDPVSAHASVARIGRATLYLSQREYDRARRQLELVCEETLTKETLSEWQLKLAYSLLMSGRSLDRVEPLLRATAEYTTYWGEVAKLYLSQMMLSSGQTPEAKRLLLELLSSTHLSVDARLGLSNIALYNQEYQEALSQTQALDHEHLTPMQQELSLLVSGNAWYRMGQPAKTIEQLGAVYEKTPELLTAEDQLVLAAAYMEQEQTDRAIPHLLLATRGGEQTAGVANLYLARARRDMGLYSEALASYHVASAPEIPAEIREAAMYEQVLLLRSRSSSAFGQEVSLCEEFLNSFSRSVHRPAMVRFLTESYYRSTDYQSGLKSIENISSPTRELLEAKVYLLNHLTQEAQSRGQYQEAKVCNDQALSVGVSSPYTVEANLLSAQLLTQLGQYAEAQTQLERFLAKSHQTAEQTEVARYLLGYSYMKQRKFASAQGVLTQLIKGDLTATLRADALARLGDCYYMQSNYTPAARYYNEAYEAAPESQVYALYKLSDIEGLKKNYSSQIAALDRLISRHPNSAYKPRAMYDQGRALELSGRSKEAIDVFARLVQHYAQVEYGRKGALELALLYYNTNQTDSAIEVYKALLSQSPQSAEAKQAYESLRSIYVEEGRSEDFVQYGNSLGGSYTVGDSEAVKLSFESAERAYQTRSPQAMKLLKDYLQLQPRGATALLARYYIADLLYSGGEDEEALTYYQGIYGQRKQLSQDQYTTLLERMADLHKKHGVYGEALPLLQELLTLPLDQPRQHSVLLTAVEVATMSKQYKWTIEQVEAVLKGHEKWSVEEQDLLTFHLAQSYLNSGRQGEVVKLLSPMSARVNTYAGARGTLLLAQYYVNSRKNMTEGKRLLDLLVDKAYPDATLSARTIITLSDWYQAQGDPDTARLYLESLLKNYTDTTTDIRSIAEEKLSHLPK